jgi:hypothetical protein
MHDFHHRLRTDARGVRQIDRPAWTFSPEKQKHRAMACADAGYAAQAQVAIEPSLEIPRRQHQCLAESLFEL